MCDAYADYLYSVIPPTSSGPDTVDLEAIAERHSIPGHVSPQWMLRGITPDMVRRAIRQLAELASGSDGVRVRLMCRCLPKRCHVEALIGWVMKCMVPLPAPASEPELVPGSGLLMILDRGSPVSCPEATALSQVG